MNAVSAAVFLGLVALCAGHAVVAPVQQYYVPTSYSSQYQYVQPQVQGVKYVQQQYAVPSTQQYVYKTPVSYTSPSYYSSPVVSSSYGYGVGAYSPSYVYGAYSPSYVYGYGKK